MTLNYTTFVSQLANLMVVPSTSTEFQIFLPGDIDYAEQRIYRELDLLFTQETDGTAQVSSGNRNFTVPTSVGTFITVDSISIITPSSTPPTGAAGSRVPLVPVSPSFIDTVYPSGATATGVPEFYAMRSNSLVILGPAPDAPYFAEVIGIQRPTPLSSGNSSTILTQYVPDLFMAAAMVFASAYQRDFSLTGDNPQQGASWESQYQLLMKSAAVEQARAKFESEGWTSNQPAPTATPPRV